MKPSIDDVVKSALNLESVVLQQDDQVRQFIKSTFDGLRTPSDASDWRTVDLIVGHFILLYDKAMEEYSYLAASAVITGFTKESGLKLFHALTYRIALSSILRVHVAFVIDGVYRSNNADWYLDRLYSAIDGSISASREDRRKELENELAKIRKHNR